MKLYLDHISSVFVSQFILRLGLSKNEKCILARELWIATVPLEMLLAWELL